MDSSKVSKDIPSPKGGPPFLSLDAWPYRVEMAVATIVLAVALFYWQYYVVGHLDIAATIFWFLWPDLAAFIPIGVVFSRGRRWPRWGSPLYNTFHTFLVWAPIFAIWSFLVGAIAWPLFGWAGHITLDRAVGYYLRAPVSATSPR